MRIGILGLGSAGRRHARNALALGHNVFVYDHKQVSAGDSRIVQTTKRGDLFAETDAIVIATPTENHFDDMLVCLEQGKHILVEKPIALIRQRDEVRDLIQMNARRAEPLTIAVGYNLRFHPLIMKLKQTIATSKGKVPFFASFICSQYTESPDAIRHGCLETWATHEIDLAEYLLGPLRVIDHNVNHYRIDAVLWQWNPLGCRVTIHSDMIAKQPIRMVTVCAEDWSVQINLEYNSVTDNDYRVELEEFIATCSGVPSNSLASGVDGLAVLEISARTQV